METISITILTTAIQHTREHLANMLSDFEGGKVILSEQGIEVRNRKTKQLQAEITQLESDILILKSGNI